MGRILALIAAAVCSAVAAPAPAMAEEPGCQRSVTVGLSPQIRRICDGPIQPGGWWARARQVWAPAPVGDYCQQYGYLIENCPPAIVDAAMDAAHGPVDTYIVTPATVPAGEPGHLG